ncbi:MAG: tetraacyldisaccharide 4'-kinase [Granulicella sp.]
MSARRPLLVPLVPLYAAALWLKRRFFAEAARLLVHPVVSVGSLSAGGAGKTPVVEALAGLLGRAGFTVDILSRGYGRVSGEAERVDPAGSATSFGDEPLLLARRTGLPVYVGAERYAAGLLAEKEVAGSLRVVHLLDDGFQHRRLARQLDVVLLTLEDAEDFLLPAGNLREQLSRLREADVVVLRLEEETALRPVLEKFAGAAKAAWVIGRRLEIPAGGPVRPLVFCGIARAESFFTMLQAEGIAAVETMAFGDHHDYAGRDIERLIEAARRANADGFVTTEKDAVKITDEMRIRLETVGPMAVARLTVDFVDPEAVLARMSDGSVWSEPLPQGLKPR